LITENRAIKAQEDSTVAAQLPEQTVYWSRGCACLSTRGSGRGHFLFEEKDARATERLITESGRKAILLLGDIGETSETKVVAQRAIDGLSAIDSLVNNAAFQRTYEKFEDYF
jgi:NAD(P)-dependent dehydrogenase (short-subunit alcohol dehydrogenase family)